MEALRGEIDELRFDLNVAAPERLEVVERRLDRVENAIGELLDELAYNPALAVGMARAALDREV